MTLRTNVLVDKTLLHTTTGLVLAISTLLIGSLAPSVATAQSRYPTFGVPSSVFKTTPEALAAGTKALPPRSPDRPQASVAPRKPVWNTSRGLLRQVSHSEDGRTAAATSVGSTLTSRESASREPARFPGRGRYVNHAVSHDTARPNSGTSPIRQTAGDDREKRSFLDRFRRRLSRSKTTSERDELDASEPKQRNPRQSSVRHEPTAELQQSPPRHDAAVRPTDGRETFAKRLARLYERAAPRVRHAPPSQPPVEPDPFVPPTYKAQPARRMAAQPPQQPLPGTTTPSPRQAAAEPRRQAQAGPSAREPEVPRFLLDLNASRQSQKAAPAGPVASVAETPTHRTSESVAPEHGISASVSPVPATDEATASGAASASDLPQPPAQQQAAMSFEMIPLTEPVLAPPAEEEWDRTVRHDTEWSSSSQHRRHHDTQSLLPKDERPPIAGAPAANAPATAASPSTSDQSPSDLFAEEMPFEDLLPEDDLFPEDTADEEDQTESIDDGLFLLPRHTPARLSDAGHQGAATTDRPAGITSTRSRFTAPIPEPSPDTGRRLNETAFPGDWDEGALAQPGRIFVEDERAIDPTESLDIDPDTLVSSSFRPSGTDTVQDTQAHFRAAMAGSPKQQIATREGLGLKGFCPVALRDRRVLEDGRAAYMSYYAGKPYFFSSPQAKAAFDDNPRRYVPAADGYDVARTAIIGELREGSLDHAVWYKDRLYLFESAESLKTFMALPSAMGVDE